MTAATTSDFQAILDGNTHKTIPISAYESNLAGIYKMIPPSPNPITFDPMIHLTYYATTDPVVKDRFHQTRRLTMDELGLTHPHQISPIGVSDPFQLFTEEAIIIMRRELLQKETFLKYARYSYNSTSGLDCVVRGFVKDGDEIICPFTYSAWTSSKTMELVSWMAGVELEIVMDYEIAHSNISMKSENLAEEERIKHARELVRRGSNGEDLPAVVGWHYDSYPFVCVLMLSDTTNMIGGETALRMGNGGEVAVVPGPVRGSATVLQGRMIEHIAPVPLGASERITMVTSYRAKDPKIRDGSVLTTIKPELNWGSRYNQFYSEWIDYRVELMKKKLDIIVREKFDASGKFDKKKVVESLKEIEEYIKNTYE
ncbi:hypothetical protein SBY92_000227 [Candida maltosa Xu316]|uniref:Fe2OG dioxygenase domain-containing protein n=1 Tax=Candida maltosa (strain Xu316) TaxID=1245528 RepID=M3JE27_CANMX|nr:hypothetical protein G210_4105 [Candida maltosa Xu316]